MVTTNHDDPAMQVLQRSHEAPAIPLGSVAALSLLAQASELMPVPNGPQLSCNSGYELREIRFVDDRGVRGSKRAPVERPLSVLVDGHKVGSLMTLGAAPEWLVVGYLRNQKLFNTVTDIESVRVDWESKQARVVMRSDRSVVGEAEDLDWVQLEQTPILRSTLLSAIESMRLCGDVFRAAGSVHGCALFKGADRWISVEDVSRRNAIDIVSGWMAVHGVSGHDKILCTTGRLSAEIIGKVALSGISVVVSPKGVTATGYELASKLGMAVFGRAVDRRYVCYTGLERFDPDA